MESTRTTKDTLDVSWISEYVKRSRKDRASAERYLTDYVSSLPDDQRDSQMRLLSSHVVTLKRLSSPLAYPKPGFYLLALVLSLFCQHFISFMNSSNVVGWTPVYIVLFLVFMDWYNTKKRIRHYQRIIVTLANIEGLKPL